MKTNAVSRPRCIMIELTRGGPTQVKKIGKQKSDIQLSRFRIAIDLSPSRNLNHSRNEANCHD